jgi:uncharacterized phage protein (TIGR01671 family)
VHHDKGREQMREIIFRGIDKRYNKNNKPYHNIWRYGDLCKYENGQIAIASFAKSYGYSTVTSEVIPETVGQYTGMKDKNGVEIYEGDIFTKHVRCYISEFDTSTFGFVGEENVFEGYIYAVVHYVPSLGYVGKKYKSFEIDSEVIEKQTGYLKITQSRVEVIGNIHDNPELMEVANDNN